MSTNILWSRVRAMKMLQQFSPQISCITIIPIENLYKFQQKQNITTSNLLITQNGISTLNNSCAKIKKNFNNCFFGVAARLLAKNEKKTKNPWF